MHPLYVLPVSFNEARDCMEDILRLVGRKEEVEFEVEEDTSMWTHETKRHVSKLIALAVTLRRETIRSINVARLCLLNRAGPVGPDIAFPLLWRHVEDIRKDDRTREESCRGGVRTLREIMESERFAKTMNIPNRKENIIART